jgi:hypothetical protein
MFETVNTAIIAAATNTYLIEKIMCDTFENKITS